MRYKLKITIPKIANNNLTFLLVLGTSVSLTKVVSGVLSNNEIITADTSNVAKM
ncbi:hypothetical protein D3C87_2106090 [compost metagenome]